MSSSVDMPALGESVTEGTVTRWLKAVGDRVEVDEPLLEVSTDKVDTEIPSPVAGVLQEILVEEDETVEVGAKLAMIGDGEAAEGSDDGNQGESKPEPEQEPEPEPEPEQKSEPQQEDEPETAQPSTDKDVSQEDQDTVTGDSGEGSADGDDSDDDSGSSSGGSSSGGTEIVMPALGESVTEGTVTRWLKTEGDDVEVDEPLLEVSTDKVDTEIPSPVAGTLQKILVAEDETVQVGAPLAVVGDGGGADAGSEQAEPEAKAKAKSEPDNAKEPESKQSEPETQQSEPETKQSEEAPAAQEQEAEPEAKSESAPAPASEQPSAPAEGGGGDAANYVTPLVRKLASEHGVDLTALSGTGVGGRIRKQDVLAAAKAASDKAESESDNADSDKAESDKVEAGKGQTPQAEAKQAGGASAGSAPPASRSAGVGPQRGTTEKMSRLRKVIASRMVESLQTSAQLTTVVEVDLTKVARLRARAKDAFASREGVKLSYLPFLALATIEALKAHPKVNATLDGETIVYPAQENLGVAVDTDRGLLVPVIRDAGDLNIAGLARKIADLADRTRNNKITPDELGGGTFTLTNTGSRGALFDTPIINQPQVGILGTGALVKRPVVVEDADGAESIAVRSMMYLALSYDHRLVDGADAARFLTTIKERLEEGSFEADLNL